MAAPAPGFLAPSAPAPSQRVELRHLAVQPGQQARQFQVVQPAVTVAQAPASQPPADPDAQDRLIRCRVIYVSLAIAVWIVIGSFLHCAFDTAAFEDAFSKIQSVTHISAGGHRMATFVLRQWQEAAWSIGLNLLVPLCGYLGVKKNEQCLMGWFCGCNALHCCCAIWALVSLLVFLMGLSATAPEIFNFLDTCDPVQCAPRGFNHSVDHVVDCLAANTWKDYHPRFGEAVKFHEMCPKIFLHCTNSPEAPQTPWAMQGHENPFVEGMSVDGVEARESHGVARGFATTEEHAAMSVEKSAEAAGRGFAKGFLSTTEEHAAMLDEESTEVGGGSMGLGRRLAIRREAYLAEQSSATQVEAHRHFRRRHHHEWPVPPKPADPLTQCKPAETVEIFHQARVLAPQLLPKLVLFLAMKLVLLIPVILLGCFGFCWGKDLWARLGQGYAQLHGPAASTLEVPLQPLVAIAVPHPQTEDLAQPLMMNAPPPLSAPPPLPVLQQGCVVAGRPPTHSASSPPTTDQE